MATHDYVLDNATGANFRSDLNNALAAIVSNNSSSTEPSTKYAYQWWADTNEGVLKIRNSSNDGWVTLLQLDGTLTLEDGSASAPALGFRDDLNTGIFSSAADNLDITTGGTTRVNVSSTGINVTGTVVDDGATHDGDVTFTGASANILFDKSANSLEFADNAKATFGTANDLEIYHNGSNSFLDNNTGNLYFRSSGGQILFRPNNSEDALILKPDSAVELYFDNSKKFETFTNGVRAANNGHIKLASDSGKFFMGAGDDAELFHDGTNLFLNGDGTNDTFLRAKSGENSIKLVPDGAVELYFNNGKRFETNTAGVEVTGNMFIQDGSASTNKVTLGTGGDLNLYHDGSNSYIENHTGELYIRANSSDVAIQATSNGAVNLRFDDSTKFATLTNGVQVTGQAFFSEGTLLLEKPTVHHHRILANDTGNDLAFQQSSDTGSNTNFTTYLRIEDGGNISLPVDNQKLRLGASADLQLYHDGTDSYIDDVGTGNLKLRTNGDTVQVHQTNGEKLARFNSNGSAQLYFDNNEKLKTTSSGIDVTGAITVNGSALSTGGGKILQVISTMKTDTFSSTSSSFTDVTGLSVTITPSSSSNKILVMTFVNFAHSSENRTTARVVRVVGSSEFGIGEADSASNRVRSQFIGRHAALNGASNAVPIQILDSPSTTSACTYKFQFAMIDSGTGQINFGQNDSNSSSHARGISTITVMEVSA